MLLKPIGLNQGSFKEYGHVLSVFSGSPMADDDVITYWGKTARFDFVKNASSGILHGHMKKMKTKKLERHIKTPEMLVALKNDAILVVAKPLDTIEQLNAFHIKQGDARVLHASTWHWTPFPIDTDTCEFLVVFQMGTEDKDLDIRTLQEEIMISMK